MSSWLVAFCAFILAFFSNATYSEVFIEPSVTLINQDIQVQAGYYSFYEFNLNAGDTLNAKFFSSGGLNNKVQVWLVDYQNFQRFKANQQFLYFNGSSGEIQGLASFAFTIKQSNRYVLVVDNRKAFFQSRLVNLYVYAVLREDTKESLAMKSGLEQFSHTIHEMLDVPDFDLAVKHCGQENAFSNPNITLCTELVDSSVQKKVPGNVPFVLLHELGHSVLKLWGYPLFDNEDVADEFATVLLLMGKHENEAYQAAQYWIYNINTQEAIDKITSDDRHTISPQRARNILGWIRNSQDLLKRWQKLLAPKMQTAALISLNKTIEPWVDHTLITEELSRRGVQSETP